MNNLSGRRMLALSASLCAVLFSYPAFGQESRTDLSGYRLVRVDGAVGVAILRAPQGAYLAVRPGEQIGSSSWRLKRLQSGRIEITSADVKQSAGQSSPAGRAWLAVGEAGPGIKPGQAAKPAAVPTQSVRQIVTVQPVQSPSSNLKTPQGTR